MVNPGRLRIKLLKQEARLADESAMVKSSILLVVLFLAALSGCGTTANLNARSDMDGKVYAADLQDEPFVSVGWREIAADALG